MAKGYELVWKGRTATREYRETAAAALFKGAELLLTEANKTVPIEEGTLARSGETSLDAGRLEAAVSYDTPYARVQHEDTALSHDPGRRAKWLQLTLQEQSKRLLDFISDEIAKEVR